MTTTQRTFTWIIGFTEGYILRSYAHGPTIWLITVIFYISAAFITGYCWRLYKSKYKGYQPL